MSTPATNMAQDAVLLREDVTALVVPEQAIVPEHVHPERYSADMASPRGSGWSAYPFPSSIILYQAGQGYPDFDPAKAEAYFRRVNDRIAELVVSTIEKWDAARLFR